MYILFDMDGTLTESHRGIVNAFRHALTAFDIPLKDSNPTKIVGPPLIYTLTETYGLPLEQALPVMRKQREYMTEKGVFENKVYDGVAEMLATLKSNGHVLALATSKPLFLAEIVLRHFDLTKYFTVVCGAEDADGRGSAKTIVVRKAISGCGEKDLSKYVLVGDRRFDCEGAKNNQIPCVGVLYGYGDRQELETAGASYIVATVADLQALLLNWE